jgi:hypothetical protein
MTMTKTRVKTKRKSPLWQDEMLNDGEGEEEGICMHYAMRRNKEKA